jgi:hypothetical protein
MFNFKNYIVSGFESEMDKNWRGDTQSVTFECPSIKRGGVM